MKLDFKALEQSSSRLPSLPGVVTEIIQLIHERDVDLQKVALLIGRDPALAAKVLRFVNSPLYAQRHKVENVRRAIVIMGLNATISLALSFSLTASIRGQHGKRLDYVHFWRRSLLAAAAALELGDVVAEPVREELFLAGLLQDIGMLALDRLEPDFYRALDDQRLHDTLSQHEREHLKGDHAAVGGWLLKRWRLAERTVTAVEYSHTPEALPLSHELGRFARCVALSGVFADLLILGDAAGRYQQLCERCHKVLGLRRSKVSEVLARVDGKIPELESLFDLGLITEEYPVDILEQANEALMMHNLAHLHVVERRADAVEALNEHALRMAQEERRDPLTGTFSRVFLESYLPELLGTAQRTGRPLSLMLVDVSNFRRLGKIFGEPAERVLAGVARILERNVRAGDVIVRYGGEVFVVVLPGSPAGPAQKICERIMRSCSALQFRSGGQAIDVELAIGAVTHGDGMHFETWEDLLAAANSALYSAKLAGKNHITRFSKGQTIEPRNS